jgi:glycosyltransferase involved in cell wall biosynthesis
MPAYNAAPYIEAALDSALHQTVADLEIVVVDDGSIDDTAARAERFVVRDSRVRVIRQANRGASAARNSAIRAARGRYFALLDSDDVWHPDFLQAQVAILESRSDIAIVTTNAVHLGGPRDGQPVHPCPDPRPAPTRASIIADETAVFIMCVFRREVYDTIGGFDESKATNEDYDYWIRATHAGFRLVRNDTPLAQYRWHADSLSANERRMLRGILMVLEEHRPRVAGCPDERVVLERQIDRFQAELLAAEARTALEGGDYRSAARHLDALNACRPDLRLSVARVMARWTPGLLVRLYQARRAYLARAATAR